MLALPCARRAKSTAAFRLFKGPSSVSRVGAITPPRSKSARQGWSMKRLEYLMASKAAGCCCTARPHACGMLRSVAKRLALSTPMASRVGSWLTAQTINCGIVIWLKLQPVHLAAEITRCPPNTSSPKYSRDTQGYWRPHRASGKGHLAWGEAMVRAYPELNRGCTRPMHSKPGAPGLAGYRNCPLV